MSCSPAALHVALTAGGTRAGGARFVDEFRGLATLLRPPHRLVRSVGWATDVRLAGAGNLLT